MPQPFRAFRPFRSMTTEPQGARRLPTSENAGRLSAMSASQRNSGTATAVRILHKIAKHVTTCNAPRVYRPVVAQSTQADQHSDGGGDDPKRMWRAAMPRPSGFFARPSKTSPPPPKA